jgi:hypothetical protein
MALEDAALDMIVKEGEDCRDIVNKANFSACPPEMRRVYLFLINASLANLKQRRAGAWHIIGAGGLGVGLIAGLEIYGRIKGWW